MRFLIRLLFAIFLKSSPLENLEFSVLFQHVLFANSGDPHNSLKFLVNSVIFKRDLVMSSNNISNFTFDLHLSCNRMN